MRIGLAGPVSEYKHNLMKSLMGTRKFKNYKFDFSSSIFELESHSGKLHEQVYNLFMSSHILSSNTTFDSIVQAKYELDKGHITEENYITIGEAWLNTMELYNVIFYLPPTDDEILGPNEHDLWGLFDKAIYKYDVPVISLTGTDEEKSKQFWKVFL